MKTALITYSKTLSQKKAHEFKRKLKYNHVYILTLKNEVDPIFLKNTKNFHVIECASKQVIPIEINKIYENSNKNTLILPYFSGDSNSKYSISIYNKTFGTKIDPKVFKLKNKMNQFLGDEITNKKTLKMTYDEIKNNNFDEISAQIGESFILKPTNAVSSMLSFKISSKEDFEKTQKKLKKKYDYVLEEYLEGNLYSIDLFCDGKNIFLLCFCREITFGDLYKKFSSKYQAKYQNINEDFIHFVPIRYTLDLKKLSPFELNFIKKTGDKLIQNNYKGLIHLEYKAKRKEQKIGFIEWGARLGWRRQDFIEQMHHFKFENLPHEILFKKDTSRFKEKNGLFFLKNRNIDNNFIGVRTTVTKKTNLLEILKKTGSFLNFSMDNFLKDLLNHHWKINIQKIDFSVKGSSDYNLFPFYERGDTRFDYILKLEEPSFKKFIKNKFSILEKLVFHDYK